MAFRVLPYEAGSSLRFLATADMGDPVSHGWTAIPQVQSSQREREGERERLERERESEGGREGGREREKERETVEIYRRC